MARFKRWIALALCCIMVAAFAACGAEGDSPSSGSNPSAGGGPGRYVETDITPPGVENEGLKSFMTPGGALVCYTQDLTRRFESTDGGETWQESEGPGGQLTGMVGPCTMLDDGSLLAGIYNADGSSIESLLKISPDGTTAPYSIPALDEAFASGDSVHISHLLALSANRLFLNFSSGDYGGMAGGGEPEENGEDNPDSSLPDENDGDTPDSSLPDESLDAPDSSDLNQGGDGDDDGSSLNNTFVGGNETYFAGLVDLDTGYVLAEYVDWYGTAVTADEDTLYMLDYSGEVIAKSLEDGSAKTEVEGSIPTGDFAFNLAMGAGPDGLYVADGKSIHKMAPGAGTETLLDGSVYSFSDPSNFTQGVHVLENGDIVLDMEGQEGSHLYKYSWDENAELDPAKVIKVWSLYESPLVRSAISAMRKQNPDAMIEYEIGTTADGSVTAEDALKNLNVRLLNGDGPDVMLLDGCPADSYAANGMLANLDGLVDSSGLFENLATPFRTEAGTFYLPTNFKLPVLLGNEENLGKAGTLQELVQMVQDGKDLPLMSETTDVFAGIAEEDRPVLSPSDLKEIYDLLWKSGSGDIITPDGLDSDAMRELLSALLTISDRYGLGKEGGGASSGAVVMSSANGSMATVTGSPLAYASQRALLGGYVADDMQMMDYMLDPPGSAFTAFPGLSDGSFVPVGLAAINADSEKTELAAQFVETLLSDAVQGNSTGVGFPVTESGFQKQIADIDEMMQEYQDDTFEFDYKSLVELAKQPQMSDDVVSGMVWPVAQSLCEGKTDLEGAVKQLEQDLKNYLAERQ